MKKRILGAASIIAAVLALCSIGLASIVWNTSYATPADISIIYFDQSSGSNVTLKYTGDSYNYIEIHKDDSNGHFIKFHTENASRSLLVDTAMVGGGVTTGQKTLVTASWCESCEVITPTTLTFDDGNVYMEDFDVNAAFIACSYNSRGGFNINPTLKITFAGSLYVYGDRYPAIVTITSGGTDLPPGLSNYSSFDRSFTPDPRASNTPPVLKNFTAATAFGVSTTINLRTLSDPHDLEGDILSFSATRLPMNGTLNTAIGDTVVYTPKDFFAGYDFFVFTVRDGNGGATDGIATVRVRPNNPPVLSNISTTTTLNTPVPIRLVTNPLDADGHMITLYFVGPPLTGVTLPSGFTNITSPVVYTPATGFTGADAFFVTVTDGKGGFSSANVKVDVTP